MTKRIKANRVAVTLLAFIEQGAMGLKLVGDIIPRKGTGAVAGMLNKMETIACCPDPQRVCTL